MSGASTPRPGGRFGGRSGGPGAAPDTDSYGRLDRLLHKVAFQWPSVQSLLTNLEDDLFARPLKSVTLERPVFISGLPRAGTTLMLELLYATEEFASYTYRNMPFVLSPLLWQRLTAGWQQRGTLQERAHGDGMQIGHDSPEALEEVLWQRGLSVHFQSAEHTPTVTADDLNDEFIKAFRQLASKIVFQAQERGDCNSRPRYLSKNNANIARLPALSAVCPDASTLVCFRHPASHVASLHTQHQRFDELHKTDRFAADYMRWIGHFDLGANFRPIRTDTGHRPDNPASRFTEARFWLRYWLDTYQHALHSAGPEVHFVALESLLKNPQRVLPVVAEQLCLAEPQRLIKQATMLRSPTSQALNLADIDAELAHQAESLYQTMLERSVAAQLQPGKLSGDRASNAIPTSHAPHESDTDRLIAAG